MKLNEIASKLNRVLSDSIASYSTHVYNRNRKECFIRYGSSLMYKSQIRICVGQADGSSKIKYVDITATCVAFGPITVATLQKLRTDAKHNACTHITVRKHSNRLFSRMLKVYRTV